ncbi:hypothetical protein [Thalassoroseus pseudoceratinae]|uniref:hypothetical protein n=1 Tax=Thalassoroseus pseudoceratinae TaxID=2713176 RepID=UPI00141FB8F8|nr:hypothetical protein [Thalassoroseus pseudoceratinae]
MLAYLGMSLWFLGRHAVGDSASGPVPYLFTWDMFPNYPSWSARRIALVETQSGQYFQILPSRRQQYRRGSEKTHSRLDLPRNDDALRQAAEVALADFRSSSASSDDPPTYVFLLEQFWPVRFNLPDDLYEAAYGTENPRRKSWRIVDESAVGPNGELEWLPRP